MKLAQYNYKSYSTDGPMHSARSCRVVDVQGKQQVEEEQQEEFSIIWEMLTD